VPFATTLIRWLAIRVHVKGQSFPRNHNSLLWCSKLMFFKNAYLPSWINLLLLLLLVSKGYFV
jgi:hypothetical protein